MISRCFFVCLLLKNNPRPGRGISPSLGNVCIFQAVHGHVCRDEADMADKPESNPPIPTGPAHIYGNLRAAGDPSVSVIFSAVFARPLTVEKGMSPMKHQTHSQRTPLVICGTKCLQITFHAKAFILYGKFILFLRSLYSQRDYRLQQVLNQTGRKQIRIVSSRGMLRWRRRS